MLTIHQFTFNPFQENTYLIINDQRECFIVDPGCYEKSELQELVDFVTKEQLVPKAILNTHCHIDHVLGNYAVKEYFNIPLYIHKIEEPYLKAVSSYAPNYGFVHYTATPPDQFLQEGEEIKLGQEVLKVLFVPGHSAGHVAFYNAEQGLCLSGDVLFKQSIGRTDLPGGDYETLIQSVRTKLFTLPDNTIVYPGHGPSTTVGYEKKTNPFFV
jgi:hydroxyacylglutathione hydrolase